MKTFKIPCYKDESFVFRFGQYAVNTNTFIEVLSLDKDGLCPWVDLTVNLDAKLKEDEAYIHINHVPKDMYEYFVREGFIEPLNIYRQSGFVVFPLCRLNLQKFREFEIALCITDIHWDTTDDDGKAEEVELPTEVTVPYSALDIDWDPSEEEIEDAINNYLSNTYGWLVESYSYNISQPEED